MVGGKGGGAVYKVLVYSQFLEHISLIETEVRGKGGGLGMGFYACQ